MKKNLLMITPENTEINNFRKKQFNNFIQITMPYLAGFVDETKYNIVLIDEYNQKIPYNIKFDLVAITVNTPNATHCYNISKIFKEMGSQIVMGGPHATLLPDEVKAHCDFVIIGEGEYIWPEFLIDFYNDEAKDKYTCDRVPTLQKLPIPRRDLVYKRHFTKGATFATRGCPYRCSYCNLKQIYFDVFRTRPVEEVIFDIQNMQNRYFVFWDDNFFGDIEYSKGLMTQLKKLKKKWAAQVTLDKCQDENLLKLAKAAGCMYFFIGLESFSTESLLSVNKGINNVDKYRNIINLIHSYGISVQAGIIFGFDTDKKDVFQKTLKACNELGIDGATISILTPLPCTPIYDNFKKEDRLLTNNWSHFNGKTSVAFNPRNMTDKELYEGYMWFRKKFYSMNSIFKRISISKTNVIHNLIVNLGYKFSILHESKVGNSIGTDNRISYTN